jgi:GT2 family glycosyltransferase
MRYGAWAKSVDALSGQDRVAILKWIASQKVLPRFRILLASGGDESQRRVTLASIESQLYRNFDVVECDEAELFSRDWVSCPESIWILMLNPGDLLAEHALYWFATEVQAHPDASMIYADDDEMENGQRCRPRFKPDWSLTHLRATNYIGRAVVLNIHSVFEAGGWNRESLAAGIWELLLRVGERPGNSVRHITAVLLHRDTEAQKPSLTALRRIHCALPSVPPLVSIIIPTRNAVDLLRQCVESLLKKTTYPRYEIVIVDNGSREVAALSYLAEVAQQQHVRVLRYDYPFNFSAINNFAVRQAKGEVLCLLNNDTEVISPDWLEEMVGHLLQDKAGVVGAKLYYPDGRVQHAGDTVGPGGCANHLHSFIERNAPGYCNRALVAQDLSAVTAACLVTWRDVYLSLGGLNERWLSVAFNDVDYCLRVRQAGYRVVWTPHAELYHHESVSRGKDSGFRKAFRAWREVRFMRWKWREVMRNDPFYNPNFSFVRADFVLGAAPNVKRPWVKDG